MDYGHFDFEPPIANRAKLAEQQRFGKDCIRRIDKMLDFISGIQLVDDGTEKNQEALQKCKASLRKDLEQVLKYVGEYITSKRRWKSAQLEKEHEPREFASSEEFRRRTHQLMVQAINTFHRNLRFACGNQIEDPTEPELYLKGEELDMFRRQMKAGIISEHIKRGALPVGGICHHSTRLTGPEDVVRNSTEIWADAIYDELVNFRDMLQYYG